MKIIADSSRCEGHAQCNVADPDLFPLNEEGYTALTEAGREVPPGEEKQAEQGVFACPVTALRLSD